MVTLQDARDQLSYTNLSFPIFVRDTSTGKQYAVTGLASEFDGNQGKIFAVFASDSDVVDVPANNGLESSEPAEPIAGDPEPAAVGGDVAGEQVPTTTANDSASQG